MTARSWQDVRTIALRIHLLAMSQTNSSPNIFRMCGWFWGLDVVSVERNSRYIILFCICYLNLLIVCLESLEVVLKQCEVQTKRKTWGGYWHLIEGLLPAETLRLMFGLKTCDFPARNVCSSRATANRTKKTKQSCVCLCVCPCVCVCVIHYKRNRNIRWKGSSVCISYMART